MDVIIRTIIATVKEITSIICKYRHNYFKITLLLYAVIELTGILVQSVRTESIIILRINVFLVGFPFLLFVGVAYKIRTLLNVYRIYNTSVIFWNTMTLMCAMIRPEIVRPAHTNISAVMLISGLTILALVLVRVTIVRVKAQIEMDDGNGNSNCESMPEKVTFS
ncbi:hypothetical protein Ddc_01413 [Ditylenchus destructor]|nr:hypothetical protein Ddc_01413 [Ditylenchus destructor]